MTETAPEPAKKKWEVVIEAADGSSGGDFKVMAYTAAEARIDALSIAPVTWTTVSVEPKEIE